MMELQQFTFIYFNYIIFIQILTRYYLPVDAIGCVCPKPEKIDCDVKGVTVAPNPKVGATVDADPNPNAGATLVVGVPKPKEEPEVPDVEDPNPNVGAVDVVVEPKPYKFKIFLHHCYN